MSSVNPFHALGSSQTSSHSASTRSFRDTWLSWYLVLSIQWTSPGVSSYPLAVSPSYLLAVPPSLPLIIPFSLLISIRFGQACKNTHEFSEDGMFSFLFSPSLLHYFMILSAKQKHNKHTNYIIKTLCGLNCAR